MTDHPILFNSDMVLAILDGRKTQTRRIINLPNCYTSGGTVANKPWLYWEEMPNGEQWCFRTDTRRGHGLLHELKCPYGVPGDLLWVRETLIRWCESMSLDYPYYAADKTPVIQNEHANVYPGIRLSWLWKGHTRPSIHMPKWACRLWLKVKSNRVERVQEISWQDCKAEGIALVGDEFVFNNQKQQQSLLITKFMTLWDSIYAKHGHGWEVNPFVWVTEFERYEK